MIEKYVFLKQSQNMTLIFSKTFDEDSFYANRSISMKSKGILSVLLYIFKKGELLSYNLVSKYCGVPEDIVKRYFSILKKEKLIVQTKLRDDVGRYRFSYIIFLDSSLNNDLTLSELGIINKIEEKVAHHLHIFNGIKNRCYYTTDENTAKYYRYNTKAYSGDGIKICKYWLDFPIRFCDWCTANGYVRDSGLSIDRIDPLGDYAPYNCQVIPVSENSKKMILDKNRDENDLFKAKEDYYKRQAEWLSEMESKGFNKEDLI